MTAVDHRPLVGRILLAGAALLAILAALCWAGTLPIDHGARGVLTVAFGVAAACDGAIGIFFLTRSR